MPFANTGLGFRPWLGSCANPGLLSGLWALALLPRLEGMTLDVRIHAKSLILSRCSVGKHQALIHSFSDSEFDTC